MAYDYARYLLNGLLKVFGEITGTEKEFTYRLLFKKIRYYLYVAKDPVMLIYV